MEAIQQSIIEFFGKWEYYCQPDKVQKCKGQVETFLKDIDRLQEEMSEGKKKEKANLFYLKGKILDLLPLYEKSAEEYLHKSIKLNPTNGDCWNTLAHVLFKKGDLQGSQQAVTMALQHKGKNKVSLRYQSVLLRSQGKNEEERRKNIEESLKIIKDALMLDMKDPLTWYFLGNAYFSNFVANFKKFEELENALKAYNRAEQYFTEKYPDLFINRSNVEYHMEHFQAALKDCELADKIDPDAGLGPNVKKIRDRMEFTKVNLQRANELKKAKVQELISNIPNSISNNKDNLEVVSVQKLKERENAKRLLTGKIISRITTGNDVPHSYLSIDNEGIFFTLSLYNVNTDKISQKLQHGALISVLNPQLKYVSLGELKYPSVQVFEPIKLRVNEHWLTKEEFSPAEVRNEAFQK